MTQTQSLITSTDNVISGVVNDGGPLVTTPLAPLRGVVSGDTGPCPKSTGYTKPREQCDRCYSTEFRDIEVHGGESVRRDCTTCGRTLDFPKWQGRDRREAIQRLLATEKIKTAAALFVEGVY